MELFRQECQLRLGPNWGKVIYDRLQMREEEISKLDNRIPLAPNKKVQNALDSNPVITGPLDITNILNDLTEDDQCDFFSRYPKCEILIMRNWTYISDKILRCISLTLGESLIELDLTGSLVNSASFEIILARVYQLKVLTISECAEVDGPCMGLVTKISSSTLHELYASKCLLFRSEPLFWIAGQIGAQSRKLNKLRVIDLSHCQVEDRALHAISLGMHRLRFINLSECLIITDSGVIDLVVASPQLQVLNLAGCQQLTNKSINALAKSCKSLTSLNLNRCNKINNKAIIRLAKHCTQLQALNIAGLGKITELSLCALAENCLGLLMLNITGCDDITLNGLKAYIKGRPYIENARAYFGFKPIDNHIDKKLNDQIHFKRNTAAFLIQKSYQDSTDRETRRMIVTEQQRNNAARCIQSYIARYLLRLKFYRIWKLRVHSEAAIEIQRIYRGMLGRKRSKKRATELQQIRNLSPMIIIMQKIFRGHCSRKLTKFVADALRKMYSARRREAETGLAVRLQSIARRHLAYRRLAAFRELRTRRRIDENNASIVLQCLIRCFIAKMLATKIRLINAHILEVQTKSVRRIEVFYLATKGRYSAKLSAMELRILTRKRLQAAMRLQRCYRGFLGRQMAYKRRIEIATRIFAATTIQRVYRGACVLHWRDMRMNIIAAFILDRQYIERKDRVADSRFRYQKFLKDLERDSASDSDPEQQAEEAWTKDYDYHKRVYYWINNETKEISYEEPKSDVYIQRALIGNRIRIYWVLQKQWFGGIVTKYHRKKMRHRIDYDDGDHEWINLEREQDRVQVELQDGSWVMYQLYRPKELVEEWKEKEQQRSEEDFKSLAYRDALQWRPIIDDSSKDTVLYLSELTGEIRTGVDFCTNWVVQDDGFGFPCFFNVKTGITSHEDPRFVDDVGKDLEQQRAFIMQELRYTMYFCKDFWSQYNNAIHMHDDKRLKSIMKIIFKSTKPKLLAAILIRAKSLHEPVSIVDKPVDPLIIQELEYASWIVERFKEIMERAAKEDEDAKIAKKNALSKVIKDHPQQVFCFYCKHETKRNLEYCPTCGKPQVFYTE